MLKDSILVGIVLLCGLFFCDPPRAFAATDSGSMTDDEASSLGEEFGIVVGAVD